MRFSNPHLLVAAGLLAAGTASAEIYQLDPNHTRVGFGVRHMTVSTVRGEFHEVASQIDVDEADMTKSSIAVTLQVASIDTGVEDRDNHLRSPDFFDATTHPQITFTSKSIANAAAGQYVVTGDLTIRGVTKQVELPVTVGGPIDLGDSLRMGVSGELTINRKDYGVSWSRLLDNGGLVVGDDVRIELEAELVRPKEASTGGTR